MTEPNPSQTEARATRRPVVAVVAVHGVGDHQPGTSASSISELLLRLRKSNDATKDSQYTSFRTTTISIPVKPAFLAPEPTAANTLPTGVRLFEPFRERSRFLRDKDLPGAAPGVAAGARGQTPAASNAIDSADHQFMRAQLRDYVSAAAPYETLRLEGQRLDSRVPSAPEADIHVYEMQWTELSRLKWGAFQIAYQLYQLLFHIPHLGRQAVEHAALEFPGERWWRWYRKVHTGTVRWFTLLLPLLWLTMAATVLTVVPRAIPSASWRLWIVVGLPAIVALVVIAWLAYRSRRLPPAMVGMGLALVAAGVAAGVVWFAFLHRFTAQQGLSLEWLAVASFAVCWITGRYDAVRPGARMVGWPLQLLAAGALAILVARARSDVDIVNRTLNVFEVEFVVALFAWAAFYGLAALSAVMGVVATWRCQADLERDRVRRASWTARATLAMSGTAVLTLGLPIWALLYFAFLWALPVGAVHASVPRWLVPGPRYDATVIEELFKRAAGPGLSALLVLAAVLGVVIIWTVIPSAWAEIHAPTVGDSFAEPMDSSTADPNRRKREAEHSERLGHWLTAGLKCVKCVMTALFVVMIAAPLLTPLRALTHWSWLVSSESRTQTLILKSGAWLAASAIGLAAFRGRLKNILLGFRPVLDAILDVDNYLREHPRTNTPRARIAERFASLFRYLCKWRDATGNAGYTAIIFVAHSQGTVITADYLGFLAREGDPDAPGLLSARRRSRRDAVDDSESVPNLYLFTMGCPLRQLYSEAFPHLFSWVRGDGGAWQQALPPATGAYRAGIATRTPICAGVGTDIASAASPDPVKVGLERWVNAYRSGDYVGRELWRTSAANRLYPPYIQPAGNPNTYWAQPPISKSEDPIGTRREFCIGAGAHTHYWDDTAKAIAVELDRVIDEAIAK